MLVHVHAWCKLVEEPGFLNNPKAAGDCVYFCLQMNLMRGIDLRKVSIDMLLLLLLQAVLHMSRNEAVSHLATQLDQPRHVLQAVFPTTMQVADKMPGASGAEMKAACTEAGMFALRERRVHVTQEDFEMACAKVSPAADTA